jgi:tetratricopeptide (TPR) repeat protein
MRATANAYEQGLKLSSEGRHLEAIGCFEAALTEMPENPKVLFALGNTAHALGLPGPAEAFFRQVLVLEPGRIEALVNLANLLRANGQFDATIALLQPAAARNPQSAELALTLGSAFREKGDVPNAVRHYRKALETNPDFVPALVNLADILCDDGAREEARALYDRAIAAEPGNAQARLNRAILHFLDGSLEEAWHDYRARLALPGKVPATALQLPEWKGRSLEFTRLLVRAEQGVGDQLLFASLMPELTRQGGTIILECEKRLVPLFARSFPRAIVRPAQVETVSGRPVAGYDWLRDAGGATAMIAMGSLPELLRPTPASFPDPHAYLVADAEETARWKGTLGKDGIGICWRSGKSGGHRAIQYAPLEAWGAFVRDLPGTPVCVQYDAMPDEIAALEAMSGRSILVPDGIDQKQELDRACALLSALRAVVTAPTAVSWLAAGAGVATFKILYDTSWTALGETYEPFAPSCTCVMPQQRGDWNDTFAKARKLIAQL